ncbi:MAG: exodeoxyribonuclease VII small subunit [Leptospirales bacterium]
MAETRISQKKGGPGPLSFEEKMGRLEEIVHLLEGGDRALEESMSLFEEGVKLSNECREVLEKTERRITLLLKNQGSEVPFDESLGPDLEKQGDS